MKLPVIIATLLFFIPPAFHKFFPVQHKQESADIVPLAGNTWVVGATSKKVLTARGIQNWSDASVQFATYVRVNQPGQLHLRIKATPAGESKLRISINGQQQTINITGEGNQLYEAGNWTIKDSGYVKIVLSAVSKTNEFFPEISDYEIEGSAINASTVYVKNNEGNFFYWGRRGPSVHLNYPFADSLQAEWFYNEVTVPAGEDVNGSYYMAAGFGEGYFGIQVNSPTERRILFSVWSPFKTDDPKSIPDEKKIVLLKKGEGVHAGEFGNEGSGGQSYLVYNWKAATTYRFLLHGEPDQQGNTIYTAYFFAPEKNNWMLIASFKRPETTTYLKRFHSFLENFNPDQGDKQRKVLFGNQWIRTAKGNWLELTKAGFTYDNTAAKRYRLDYAGGTEGGQFYLKNCGFFNDYTPYRSSFERSRTGKQPTVALTALP